MGQASRERSLPLQKSLILLVEPRGIEPEVPCENEHLSPLVATETSAGTGSVSGNVSTPTSDKSEFEVELQEGWDELRRARGADVGGVRSSDPTERSERPVEQTTQPIAAETDPFEGSPVGNLTKAIARAAAAGQWDLATLLGEQLRELTKLHVRTHA